MSVVPMHRQNARERVAGEVRAHLARRRISASQVGQTLGLTQSAMSRRMTGTVPFDVDELDAIAELLGVDPGLFFGRAYESPRPDGPDGGSPLPRLDSNQQPAVHLYPQVSALPMAA